MNISFKQYLESSKEEFKKASHLSYVTLTILKENRLLSKILMYLHSSVSNLIKAFLSFEKEKNKLILSKRPEKNLEIFISEVAPKYLSKEEFEVLIKILKLAKNHKESHLEFVRKEKFVIFLDGKVEVLTSEKVKLFLFVIGKIISKFPK